MRFSVIEGEEEFRAYDEFVSSCSQSVAQQTLAWKRVLEGIWPDKNEALYLKASNQKGDVIGVIPSFVYKGVFGNVCVSLPHAGAYGGILVRPDMAPDERAAVYAGLSQAWFDECEARSCLTATVATAPFSNDLDFYISGFKPDYRLDRFFQYVDLKKELSKEIPYTRGARRNLRDAAAARLEVFKDNSLERVREWYRIHEARMKDLNAFALPWKMFEGCIEHACPSGKADFWFVRSPQGELLSGCLYLKHNAIVDVFIMGGKTDKLSLGANYALSDATIRAYAAEGFSWYNWQACTSKHCGVYEFKAAFGSVDGDNYYLTKVLGDVAPLRERTVQEVKDNYKWHYALPFSEFKASAQAPT